MRFTDDDVMLFDSFAPLYDDYIQPIYCINYSTIYCIQLLSSHKKSYTINNGISPERYFKIICRVQSVVHRPWTETLFYSIHCKTSQVVFYLLSLLYCGVSTPGVHRKILHLDWSNTGADRLNRLRRQWLNLCLNLLSCLSNRLIIIKHKCLYGKINLHVDLKKLISQVDTEMCITPYCNNLYCLNLKNFKLSCVKLPRAALDL